MNTAYSFADVTLVFSHSKVGRITVTGEGVGSITISRANDVTQHDVAADGAVMATKIIAKNGAIALSVQQTSAANTFFKKWYQYLLTAPTSEWTATTATLKNILTGETISLIGVSPQKLPDAVFQQTGQQVTWNMMAAEVVG